MLQALHDKWVIGREHCDKGGGQYFDRKRVRQARRDKCKEFPRSPADQYEVDKERVRYIRHLRVHDPNRERMFTHFVIGTQDSRNARMRAYELANGITRSEPEGITSHTISTQGTYIVIPNDRTGAVYAEIAVSTLSDGNVVGMYCTGDADVFTLRDVKYRGKMQVQLVPHLASVKHTERRTWRLARDESTVRRLVWRHADDVEIWRAAPLMQSRNARAGTTRSRIAAAVVARPPLAFHKQPRKRKRARKRNGCCCGSDECSALRSYILDEGLVSFDASFVVPTVATVNIPSAPTWVGGPEVSTSTRKGRQKHKQLTRWVDHTHAVATQVALDQSRTNSASRPKRFSMVHWHPAFLCDALEQGWRPGKSCCCVMCVCVY